MRVRVIQPDTALWCVECPTQLWTHQPHYLVIVGHSTLTLCAEHMTQLASLCTGIVTTAVPGDTGLNPQHVHRE